MKLIKNLLQSLGLKNETGTGVGVYEERHRVQLSVSLNHYTTAF